MCSERRASGESDDAMNTNSRAPLETVLRYHQATKHHVHRFAHGPGYLDWDTQPNPFRRYNGASLIALDTVAPTDEPRYDDAFIEGRSPPVPLHRHSISQLFFDSLASCGKGSSIPLRSTHTSVAVRRVGTSRAPVA